MKMQHFVISVLFDGTECMLKNGPLTDDGRIIVEDQREISQLGGASEAVFINDVTSGRFALQHNRKKLHDILKMGGDIVVSNCVEAVLREYLPDGHTSMFPVSVFDHQEKAVLGRYYWLNSNITHWKLPFPSNAIFRYGGGGRTEWVAKEALVNKIILSGAVGFNFLKIDDVNAKN